MMKNLFLFPPILASLFFGQLHALELDHLIIEDGFNISIFAENLDSPRQMTEGEDGTIFVGERGGQIIALVDSDDNGQADSKIVLARGASPLIRCSAKGGKAAQPTESNVCPKRNTWADSQPVKLESSASIRTKSAPLPHFS
jgi:hypothetical protein